MGNDDDEDQAPPPSEPQRIFASGRDGAPPELRILHYNDVYHVDPASAEPVGGLARFMTMVKGYRQDAAELPGLLTLFSGDAFNPSLESSVTKGSHMVPVLNAIGTDCACVGNHELDFGVDQFRHLAEKCEFPWLLANILDPALGKDVPLGNARRTHMLTTPEGIKVGLIGLGEREWLETINCVPPNIIYRSAAATAKELVPDLRAQGADVIICLSHQREPNDNKLAEETDGLMDIILGGHDHSYNHSVIKGTHVLRSGSDFKQMSFLEARRKTDGSGRWDFDIWRRDVTSDVAEHENTAQMVSALTTKLQKSLSRPVGWTAMPLDARFSTVRTRESNMGNFICDVMRRHHGADCAIMAGGTVRGDQIYPPGVVRIKDITNCFPFEDPVILLRVSGQAIWDALENGVSMYPALEGRFPQVSNIVFTFDPRREGGKRLDSLLIGGEQWVRDKKYLLATRGYMGRAKDGFTSLLVQSEGGDAEEVVDEEHGMLISAMLRQFFMALQTSGQWTKLSEHWVGVAERAVPLASVRKRGHAQVDADADEGEGKGKGQNGSDSAHSALDPPAPDDPEAGKLTWRSFLRHRLGLDQKPLKDDEDDDDEQHLNNNNNNSSSNSKNDNQSQNKAQDPSKPNGKSDSNGNNNDESQEESTDTMDLEILLFRKFFTRWARKTGVKTGVCDPAKEGEVDVDWTRVIAPRVEGRIRMVAG